jgi:hypothetical protein
MTLETLLQRTGWTLVQPCDSNPTITGVFIGDLLSYVMGNGESGQVWITMQSHPNVIAVAALKEFAAVILIDDILLDPQAAEHAQANGIPIVRSPMDAYASAKVLMQLGL